MLYCERKGLLHQSFLSFLIFLPLVRENLVESPPFVQLFVVLVSERVYLVILPLSGLCRFTVTKLVVAKFSSSFAIRLFKGDFDHFLVLEVVRDESKESLMNAHQGRLLHVVNDANLAC